MSSSSDSSLPICISYLKSRLMKPASFLRYNEKQKANIKNLIERTVVTGESNSALIVGPRSSGKSVLIENVLRELMCNKSYQESTIVVYLNGLIHTDDMSTLKAIATQLNLCNIDEGRMIGSVAENMSLLLECLRQGNRDSTKSIIMVLNEFDLFCSHSRQTLLYNLFDVAQSAQTPICVLGLTCRLDTTELLEKRVKSRFSNRQIYMFPEAETHGQNVKVELCKDLLVLSDDICMEMNLDPQFVKNWNKHINTILNSCQVLEVINSLHSVDLSERRLRRFLLLLISKLNSEYESLGIKEFVETYHEFIADAKCNILGSLSVLEICLIIAMKHHTEIYDEEPFNFEMIYRIYMKFIKQNSLDYMTDRIVVMKAFENIIDLELIISVKNSNFTTLKEHQMFRFVLIPEQIMKGLQCYQNLPTKIQQWANCSM